MNLLLQWQPLCEGGAAPEHILDAIALELDVDQADRFLRSVPQLIAMGFASRDALRALMATDGDVQEAVYKLMD